MELSKPVKILLVIGAVLVAVLAVYSFWPPGEGDRGVDPDTAVAAEEVAE